MKKFKKDLLSVNRQLDAITKKIRTLVDSLETVEDAPKSAARKKTAVAKKAANPSDKTTAFGSVLGIISRSRKGVNVSQLKTKTGYDAKKIANVIYKAKKRGLIKSEKKGVYVKA